MTQDETWLKKYQELTVFIVTNKRNPSRHRIEDHLMLNLLKQNCKLLNAGKMKEDREGMFNKLLELGEKYKRVNQWK